MDGRGLCVCTYRGVDEWRVVGGCVREKEGDRKPTDNPHGAMD